MEVGRVEGPAVKFFLDVDFSKISQAVMSYANDRCPMKCLIDGGKQVLSRQRVADEKVTRYRFWKHIAKQRHFRPFPAGPTLNSQVQTRSKVL